MQMLWTYRYAFFFPRPKLRNETTNMNCPGSQREGHVKRKQKKKKTEFYLLKLQHFTNVSGTSISSVFQKNLILRDHR